MGMLGPSNPDSTVSQSVTNQLGLESIFIALSFRELVLHSVVQQRGKNASENVLQFGSPGRRPGARI